MTAIRRRRLIRIGVRTVLLTILALILQWGGNLERLEHVLYDLRARYCQGHVPPPTDRLVQMDIDDNAMTQIGRYPWDRDKFAEMLDEIRLAEPKVLLLDILFSEASPEAHDARGKSIDRDAILAAAIQRLNNVLTPSSLSFTLETPSEASAFDQHLTAMLIDDPELTTEQCDACLLSAGFHSKDLEQTVKRGYISMLPHAIYERIYRELAANRDARGKPLSKDELQHRVFPHANLDFSGSVLDRLYDEMYDKVMREVALNGFTLDLKPGLAPVIVADNQITPILPISTAAAYSAFVDYLPDKSDGTVRKVPLLASYRGRIVPHMGLVAACAMLDVDIHQLRLNHDSIVIPRPGGADIVIPTSTFQNTRAGTVGYLMELPIVDRRQSWTTESQLQPQPDAVKHVSIYEAWRICLTRHRMETNERSADAILLNGVPQTKTPGALALINNPAAEASYRAEPLRGAAKRKLIAQTLDTIAALKKGMLSSGSLDEDEKPYFNNLTISSNALSAAVNQNDAMLQQLTDFRADLHEKLNGRAIFLGGTGTGHVDVVPTSLHYACPGVIVHGAIFNAILTGKMWRVAPEYWAYIIIVLIGLLTGFFASALSPLKAFLATAALGICYLAINGFYLFDCKNIILGGAGTAGPLVAAALVWSIDTLLSFITETAERARITKRFRNYVDPSLVDYVIEHPDQDHFKGDAREMTMGFTDLAGFTTLTESLGPRTVQLLSEYMNVMIPIIRTNKGYVSRLMGDGIYFFFNAPWSNPDHAVHAVETVLQMHRALDGLNQKLAPQNFPLLVMRAGVCSGKVIVGDAGSKEFSDYTAVGDSVNTAARLETANKVFATKALINARAVELLNGQYLVRPIANLRVAGKTKGIFVYEPLSKMQDASDTHKQCAEISTALTDAFQSGEFGECIRSCDRLDQTFGPSKFSKLYRELSREYQIRRPDDFDGQVILTEK